MATKVHPQKATRDAAATEQIIFAHAQRRQAVVDVLRLAQRRILLSVFRCDDFKILDELDEAVRRKVRVEALITPLAKGWEKKLSDLEAFLEAMGAVVHRFRDPVVKYHAKYILVDDGPALIASGNLTRKCFEETCDFILISHEREIIRGLHTLFEADREAPESYMPEGVSDRLIVSPERARSQFTGLIEQARKSIRIIDRRLEDPAVLSLLKKQKAKGVSVQLLNGLTVGPLRSHGRLLLVDGEVATIGSISLEAEALDFRREVAVMIRNPALVAQLAKVFESLAAKKAPAAKK